MPESTHSTDTPAMLISLFLYLLKPGTSQNDPKRPETTQNQPNDPQKIAKQLETTHNFETGEIWNFPLVFFSNFWLKCPNLGLLDQKVSTF